MPKNIEMNLVARNHLCLCFLLIFHGSFFYVKTAPSVNRIGSIGKYKSPSLSVIYPNGMSSESEIPTCEKWSVCNRVDTYSRPWVERMCTCSNGKKCSSSLRANDGHTLLDRSRQYKLCESVDSLPKCRYFKDITWTYITRPDNISQQVVNCDCPENSTPYISSHDYEYTEKYGLVYKYNFACSPKSAIRCMKKEPCRLFTVNKRYPVEEVNTSSLCQCPQKTTCPKHHTDPYVLQSSDHHTQQNTEASARTYTAYCRPT